MQMRIRENKKNKDPGKLKGALLEAGGSFFGITIFELSTSKSFSRVGFWF